eukprot:TRINITY_DN35525_c0_g1_i2.p4 TRINITY_DN35525_c0_g1~~TRINITY_DN35525_c0_g1_i2.p4  ORF type:complete len:101 (-),score=3.52 TRINITY_DN35525_c0_g1_i2:326-628(-)
MVQEKLLKNHHYNVNKQRKHLNVKALQELIRLILQDGDGEIKYLLKMVLLLQKKNKLMVHQYYDQHNVLNIQLSETLEDQVLCVENVMKLIEHYNMVYVI